MTREILSGRRQGVTFEYEFCFHKGGQPQHCVGTVNRYQDGRISEVFLDVGKPGSQVYCMAKAGAISASLAIQYGAPAEKVGTTLPRTETGEPADPLAKLFDLALADKTKIQEPTIHGEMGA